MSTQKSLRDEHDPESEQPKDEKSPSAPDHARAKRRRYVDSTERDAIAQQKTELFWQYRAHLLSQREKDHAWGWLNGLGIPCHNMKIPVAPHTNTKLPAGYLDSLVENSSLEPEKPSQATSYKACTITPDVLAIYCDWRILPKIKSSKKPKIPKAHSYHLGVLRNCRSDQKAFIHDRSPKHPCHSDPPALSLDVKGAAIPLERYVWEAVRSAKALFENATLLIPEGWKTLPDPEHYTLPPDYQALLAKANDHGGVLQEEDEEEFFDRALSQPIEDVPVLSALLMQQQAGDASLSGEEAQHQSLKERFPIGVEVLRNVALENAKLARDEVEQSNQLADFATTRKEVALQLSAQYFARNVRFLSLAGIKDAEDSGLGNVLVQDETSISECQTAHIISNWLNKRPTQVSKKELETERDIGGLLNKIICSEKVSMKNDTKLDLPTCLQMAGTSPEPDLLSQAKQDAFPSLAKFLPAIFAGECKTKGSEGPKTPAQLACALNGTLVLLVLMYLDMRTSKNDPLPPWMFVYGILYTEAGVVIRAHFPTYNFKTREDIASTSEDEYIVSNPVKGKGLLGKAIKAGERAIHKRSKADQPDRPAVNSGRARWIFKSVEMYSGFNDAFKSGGKGERLRLLAVLLMIQSHSFFLLEQINAWAKDAPASSAYAAFGELVPR